MTEVMSNSRLSTGDDDEVLTVITPMSEITAEDFMAPSLKSSPSGSRPTSQQLDDYSDSGSDSGSDYSQPQSRNVSRPTSTHPKRESSIAGQGLLSTFPTSTSESERPLTARKTTPSAEESQESISSSEESTEQSESDKSADEEAPRPSTDTKHSNASTTSLHSQSSSTSLFSRLRSLSLRTYGAEPQAPAELNQPVAPVETVKEEESSEEQPSDGSEHSEPTPPPDQSSEMTEPVSPINPQDAHLSMQSIALSENDQSDEQDSTEQTGDVQTTPRASKVRHLRKPSSLDILHNAWGIIRQSTFFDSSKDEPLDTPQERMEEEYLRGEDDNGKTESMSIHSEQSETPSVTVEDTSSIWRTERTSSLMPAMRRSSLAGAEDVVEFDWHALEKNEEQEKADKELPEGVEDESTAFLLARLEQENAKFTADPKSTPGSAINKNVARARRQSRPPSMNHLKKLVSLQDTPSIRYSLPPDVSATIPDEPPPMTELEFWAALVQDYPSTASRLPTLTTTKIRAGIPPPLRGVVWESMSGARDKVLDEAFETLQNESSPYEGIINKDVGRSFPGVELFRDADGEGQKMLGRVLKCFSLHDKDIGYCQGLGFLVGPLLMNMGEKESFCVLVRLMDHYHLRQSFLPSLSGLHMRIYQFSTLLEQHHPELSEHLTSLGVEPAYLSQWFLSCFAVTCPLPMLFRIYDVIFAEGANETVMRVALALFRRNEAKMLASTEFEEVMQLLLGRALWDVYGCNADELVDDFTSLGNIITHTRLSELEKEFESQDREVVGQSAGFLPDVQAAASRFLGRLWAPSHGHSPSKGAATTLSPQTAEKDGNNGNYLTRGTFLRKSPSKQSLGGAIGDSTSSEGSNSSGSGSVTSTAPTENEIPDSARQSQVDGYSMKSKSDSLRTVSISTSGPSHLPATPGMKGQQELHTQIEDLLMALGELQRENAQVAAMLQKEREERNDDHRVVKQLLSKLTNGESERKVGNRRSMPPPARPKSEHEESTNVADKRKTMPPRPRPQVKKMPSLAEPQSKPAEPSSNEIQGLVEQVQSRLDTNARFSASLETKAQLRINLARTREQLATAEAQVKELSERAEFTETSLETFQNESESLHSEVEELRGRVNDDFKEKQKLQLTIENMQIQKRMEANAVQKKQRSKGMLRAESSGEVPTLKKLDTQAKSRPGSICSAPSSAGGLREFKLGKRDSMGSVQSIRSMKSQRDLDQSSQSPPSVDVTASPADSEPAETLTVPPTPPPMPLLKSSVTVSSSLNVPAPSGPNFARRTSSLAAREVFATPQHEPVPEEALLLELVNAKTAEATARQELDELKRSMAMAKRRAEEQTLQLQAEATSAKLEAERAKEEAEQARRDAAEAKSELFDASPLDTPSTPGMSLPATPAPEEKTGAAKPTVLSGITESPIEKPEPKKADTAPPATGGGWFWQRRTASTTKAAVERSPSEEK